VAPFPWPQRRLPSRLLVLGLGLLSGLLFTLSIPKADIHWCAWVCLVPLFLALSRAPLTLHFPLGLVAGLAQGTARTYWISQTLQLYGHLSLLEGLFTGALLILYLGLYPGLFLHLCGRLGLASPFFPWVAASLWALLEWVQTWMISGFPWQLLGYSQYRHLALLQLASLTGVYGLSFLLVLVNAGLAQFLLYRSRFFLSAGLPLLLVALALLWGHHRLERVRAEANAVLRVGIVQGNVSQDRKWKEDRLSWTTEHYASLTRQLEAEQLDLIVFPETALPFYFRDPFYAPYSQTIADLARELDTPLLVGSLEGRLWAEPRQIYNRAFLLDTQGQVAGFADKVHLVPFGEYLPFAFLFQYLEGLTAESGAFTPGQAHKPLSLPGGEVSFGVFICYESIFPEIARTLARQGASFLINTTNDAWFGTTAAPHQHLAMAALRAVETGRAVVRVANTGISGLIAPTGEILWASGLFTTETLSVEVPLHDRPTFYLRYGDVFLMVCALFLAALLAGRLYASPRSLRGLWALLHNPPGKST
jgi:apolipoprotein N-acyltransferase